MTLAAADNYRIAVRSLELAKPVTRRSDRGAGRSYAELMRILPDAEESIEITVTPNKSQVLFHVNGIDLVSRLIEGQFPNYEPVIPTATPAAPSSTARRSWPELAGRASSRATAPTS
jgi:DNA polymerase-3 subunit beta